MTVGMFLAAMAFVAAALVQLQIDVRTIAAVSLFVLYGRAFHYNATVCLLEYAAKFPKRPGKPGEVRQHAGHKN